MSNKRIEELREKLRIFNKLYREGDSQISDVHYDALVDELEELSPDDEFFGEVGVYIPDEDPRKQRLPIEMASMNKVKLMESIWKWCRLKGIPLDSMAVLSAKLDGMSLCVEENENWAWTRGDGVFGQRSDEHYAYIKSRVEKIEVFQNGNPFKDMITFGEAIMSRETFEKYADEYQNPRNLTAGIIGDKKPSERLKDIDYVRYGMVNNNSDLKFTTKSEQLAYLNKYQANPIQYEVVKISDLTEEYLKSLFIKWNKKYELDGIIIEVDDLKLQEKLGRETSSKNPCYARAYKGNFEEVKDTPYIGMTYQVSKQGYFKPVIHIDPVRLDGVTVSNVTGNNAKFIRDMQIGDGAILKVKRSGMVIPLIVEVVQHGTVKLPTECPACKSTDIGWNDSEVEMMCFNTECSGQQLMRIISFFRTLDVENVSEGVCTQFYDAGYNTIHKILNMSQSDMEGLDRFGKRKAEIVYKAIHSKMKNVPLSKLQHAVGVFKNLGGKKLALLEHFEQKPSIDEVVKIEGFSDISAQAYIDGYDKFNKFIEGMPITIQKTVQVKAVSNELAGRSFVFTGVRSKDAEEIIKSKGGSIGSGVSKKTTYLVVKEKGSGSSKEQKAIDMGVTILTLEELENLIK